MGEAKKLDVSKGFHVEANIESGVLKLVFVGRLDEYAQLSQTLAAATQVASSVASIEIDTNAVSYANSVAVKAWLAFVRALPQDRPLAFTRLSEILVELAGLVPGFLGPKGRIFSLHVPYRCPACKTRRVEVMPVSQLAKRGQGFGAPARNCPKCGKPEEFDALEEEYFSSVRWTPGA